MCGMLGGISASRGGSRLGIPQNEQLLSHRGPDDYGEFDDDWGGFQVFGQHFRLAIQDLTDNARQPMTCRSGCHRIMFNGEIYNATELKNGLSPRVIENLTTNSDTEIILEKWCSEGEAVLRFIEGMFSFVIFDNERLKITLVRDVFGVKPLFYSMSQEVFLFSSETSSLVSSQKSSSQSTSSKNPINFQELNDFLVRGKAMRFRGTFEQGIFQVLPGEIIEVEARHGEKKSFQTSSRFYLGNVGVNSEKADLALVTETVRDLFISSVELNMRGDVPVAFALSGGLDSAAIVCAARLIKPEMEIHTYSYIGSDDAESEEKWVDVVNEFVGAIPHKVRFEDEERKLDFDRFLLHQGGPAADTKFFAQYMVFKRASEDGFKVVLEGQGADEIVGGYAGYPSAKFVSIWKSEGPITAVEIAAKWILSRRTHFLPLLLSLCVKALGGSSKTSKLLRGIHSVTDGVRLVDAIRHVTSSGQSNTKHNRTSRADYLQDLNGELFLSATHDLLPRLLHHGDHNAMAHGVENRVPFTGLEFSTYMFGLHHDLLVSRTLETKFVFRKAMTGLVPQEIIERKDKIGFSAEKQKILELFPLETKARMSPGGVRYALFQQWMRVRAN